MTTLNTNETLTNLPYVYIVYTFQNKKGEPDYGVKYGHTEQVTSEIETKLEKEAKDLYFTTQKLIGFEHIQSLAEHLIIIEERKLKRLPFLQEHLETLDEREKHHFENLIRFFEHQLDKKHAFASPPEIYEGPPKDDIPEDKVATYLPAIINSLPFRNLLALEKAAYSLAVEYDYEDSIHDITEILIGDKLDLQDSDIDYSSLHDLVQKRVDKEVQTLYEQYVDFNWHRDKKIFIVMERDKAFFESILERKSIFIESTNKKKEDGWEEITIRPDCITRENGLA